MDRASPAQRPVTLWTILVAAALAQATVAPFRHFGADVPLIALAAGLALLALGTALLRLPARAPYGGERIASAWLLGLLLWLAVALATSVATAVSLAITWYWFAALALGLVALRLVGRPGASPESTSIPWAAALLVVVVAMPGLYAIGLGAALPVLSPPARHLAPDANVLALRIALLVVLGPVLALALAPAKSPRSLRLAAGLALGSIAAVGAFVIIVLLSSRAVTLLLVIAVVLSTTLAGWRRSWWTAAGLAVGVAGATLWPAAAAAIVDYGVARQSGVRVELARAALELARQAPLSGHGLGSFSVLYPAMRDPDDFTAGVLVHMDYVQLWAEGGLPLLLWLVATLLGSSLGLIALLRRRASADAADLRPLWGMAAFVLAGMVLGHAMINFPLYDPPSLVAMVVAASVGTGIWLELRAPGAGGAERPRPAEGARFATYGIVMVLAAAWLHFALTAATYVVLGRVAPLPFVAAPAVDASFQYRWAETMRTLHVGGGMPSSLLADYALAAYRRDPASAPEGLGELAVAYYDEAIERSPFVPGHYLGKAGAMSATGVGDREARIAVLEQGLARDPYYPSSWRALMFELTQDGAWTPAADAALARWLPRCLRMAEKQPAAVRALVDALPAAVRERSADAIRDCERAFRNSAAQNPST